MKWIILLFFFEQFFMENQKTTIFYFSETVEACKNWAEEYKGNSRKQKYYNDFLTILELGVEL